MKYERCTLLFVVIYDHKIIYLSLILLIPLIYGSLLEPVTISLLFWIHFYYNPATARYVKIIVVKASYLHEGWNVWLRLEYYGRNYRVMNHCRPLLDLFVSLPYFLWQNRCLREILFVDRPQFLISWDVFVKGLFDSRAGEVFIEVGACAPIKKLLYKSINQP